MRVVAVGEQVPARDQDSLRTSVAPRRVRRGCAGCELQDQKQLTTSVAEVQLTLVQMVCALRMQLKTAVVKMTVSTHIDVKENQNCRALIWISQYICICSLNCNITLHFFPSKKVATQISIANTVIMYIQHSEHITVVMHVLCKLRQMHINTLQW